MKSKRRHRRRLLAVAVSFVAAGIVAVAVGVHIWSQGMKTPAAGPLSRQVMAYAEQQVAVHRVPPPFAALQYAYIAGAYEDSLSKSNQSGALAAAKAMLEMLYPDTSTSVDSEVSSLAKINNVAKFTKQSQVPSTVNAVIASYKDRYVHDGHTLVWSGIIPKGTGKWVDFTGMPPISPRAGEWERWVVTKPIVVPPPPAVGSAEDNRQLFIVRQAVAGRTGTDVQLINFWAGSIGTATPSGIWQNQLFATAGKDLSPNAVSADKTYALIQKNIAETMSDAFMECWKVKYAYWTARPDQRIPGLKTGMPDPNFPSYISGHSTVSKAAADVLSTMVPKYKDQWESMAAQARYSRLVAGIHFDVDNSVGFSVGTDVAAQSAASFHLMKVL